jgi:anti-sigma B factor antagonist
MRLDHQPPLQRACGVVCQTALVAGHTSTGVSAMGDGLWRGPVFGVQVRSKARRSWVSLRGELDLLSAPYLQQVLDQLCRDGYPKIVLDLSGLEFLGAAGLTVFHRVDDHLHAAGGRLILHRPGWLARRALTITGLDKVLTIRPATARHLTGDQPRGRRAALVHGIQR